MKSKIRELGATLIVHGNVWNEAHEYASLLAEDEHSFYIHPFDDAILWEGHSTMVQELSEEMDEPDYIVLSVGGGGLFCGIMQGLENVGWNKTKVICAETEGAASLAKSVQAGQQLTLDSIDSIASSLGAKKVADQAWEYAQQERVIPYICSDAETVIACRNFLDECRILTEPACGAALSVLDSPLISDAKSVLFVVCGGAAMSLQDLQRYEAKFGI